MKRLFHIADTEPFRQYMTREQSNWAPPSLAAVGFVHLSFAPQLDGTLAIHYAGRGDVVLLEVDPSRVAAALRLEPVAARAGKSTSNGPSDILFPHVYRALDRQDFIRIWELSADTAGTLRAPALGDQADTDHPAGRALALR